MEKWVSGLLESSTASENGSESWPAGLWPSQSPLVNTPTTLPLGQPQDSTCRNGSCSDLTLKTPTELQQAPGSETSLSGSGVKLTISLANNTSWISSESGSTDARCSPPQVPLDQPPMKSSERPPRTNSKQKQTSLPLHESRADKRRKTQQPPLTAPPPKRGEGGRFQKRSTESTATWTSPPKTQSESVPDSPTTNEKSNSFSFPFIPMPSPKDIASDLISAILLNASASHMSPLAKLNHDLMLKKRFYPLFLQYIHSYIDSQEPQPFSYITMNLINSDCLKHFGFI